MTEVRFYHMQRSSLDQVLPEILTKAFSSGKKIVVRTSDEREAERLSDHLWVWRPDSFLPHGTKKDGHAEAQPIWLTDKDENPNTAEILILTGGKTASDVGAFGLCCELLDGRDEAQITDARARWKDYKTAGYNVTYWQQTDKGWEKRA